MISNLIYIYIHVYVTRHSIVYYIQCMDTWIENSHTIGFRCAPPNSQVLEVLEVGRVDTATGLSRLQCRAIIDQKDATFSGDRRSMGFWLQLPNNNKA